MRKIFGVLRYTFTEIFRNKVYYVLLLFAGLLIGSTLLLGSLGGEQRDRMILDLGLAGIEAFALVISVFAAVTLVLEEMESRTLYLILTRPVSRYQFILGRFFGLMALISVAFLLMAGMHLTLMKIVHVRIDSSYALALYFSWEKILLITSVAMVFSLFSTSTVSAITFTLFFWVMGHLSAEVRFLGMKSSSLIVAGSCKLFYFIAPNFQLLNVRDVAGPQMGKSFLWPACGYGFTYTAVCLALTALLFRRKEF